MSGADKETPFATTASAPTASAPTASAPTASAPTEDAASGFAPRGPLTPAGQVIDERYVLHRRLGRGGMGEVWEAHHTLTEQMVAIKLLSSTTQPGSMAHERFRREARAAASLRHPSIVYVQDYGAGDVPFLVMELLEGESLASRLERRGRVPWPRAVALLDEVAAALAFAHERGVIHRDLKPSNIFLVGRREGEEVAKIIDFGIAKLVGDAADSGLTTQTGVLVGTPAYMSPEQIRDEAIDGRSDLYSLGCVAYEMLTGALPFTGTPSALLIKHVSDRPAPLRVAAPTAEIPEALDAIVQRMLRKSPEHRYASCDALRRALARIRPDGTLSDDEGDEPPRAPASNDSLISGSAGMPTPSPETASVAAELTAMTASIHPRRGALGPLLALGVAALVGLLVARGVFDRPAHPGWMDPKIDLSGADAVIRVEPAEPPRDLVQETAFQHLERGAIAYAGGRYDEAIQEFLTGHAMSGEPAFLFNLGNCYERLGQLTEAEDALRRYLAATPTLAEGERASVTSRLESIEARLKPPPPTPPKATMTPQAKIAAAARRCRKKHGAVDGPQITVDYAVSANGTVNRAIPSVDDALGRCLAKAVRDTKFGPEVVLGQKINL